MIFKFVHLPKARQFKFTPRYYDPEQEERDDRERRIKEELGMPVEIGGERSYHANIKGQFRQAMHGRSKTSDEIRRKSNRRLMVLILILAVIFYMVFYR